MTLLRAAPVLALFADLAAPALAETTVDSILASPSTYECQELAAILHDNFYRKTEW
jgi:hypothetical protein